MAEGILHHLSGGRIEAFSAGSQPTSLHPLAVRTMAKMGIDISQQRSKHLDEFLDQSFDYIVTVCDRVREACPTFPGDPERVHWSFIDPAAVEGSEKDRYKAFGQVALQLTNRIRYLVILIEREKSGGL
jgi:protein-tyrosine-phosphatase